jgi:hypothetical protein
MECNHHPVITEQDVKNHTIVKEYIKTKLTSSTIQKKHFFQTKIDSPYLFLSFYKLVISTLIFGSFGILYKKKIKKKFIKTFFPILIIFFMFIFNHFDYLFYKLLPFNLGNHFEMNYFFKKNKEQIPISMANITNVIGKFIIIFLIKNMHGDIVWMMNFPFLGIWESIGMPLGYGFIQKINLAYFLIIIFDFFFIIIEKFFFGLNICIFRVSETKEYIIEEKLINYLNEFTKEYPQFKFSNFNKFYIQSRQDLIKEVFKGVLPIILLSFISIATFIIRLYILQL